MGMNAPSWTTRENMPEVLSCVLQDNVLRLRIRVPEALAYFPHHFPVQSIVPGVVQIDWVVHFARAHFALGTQMPKMEALKFQQLMMPNHESDLIIQYRPDTQKVSFEYANGEHRYSSGRLVFAS